MTIKIIILILILLIIYYTLYLKKSKETFQINVIKNINNKLDKIIDKKKTKKFINIKDSEYSDPSKQFLYNNKIFAVRTNINVYH